jgi:hypothetical protein
LLVAELILMENAIMYSSLLAAEVTVIAKYRMYAMIGG